jgi:hypothetical protein
VVDIPSTPEQKLIIYQSINGIKSHLRIHNGGKAAVYW